MATVDRDGKEKLWVAWTDRRSAPRQVPGVEGEQPLFGTSGEIFFRALEGASGFACRVREDGTGLRKVTAHPVDLLQGLSPDARWLVVFSAVPGEVEQYMQWQRRRLRMRPGLTCLWALAGRDKLDFETWMRMDMQYIDNWSLGLDWKILLGTIPRALMGRGAN